MSKTRFASRVRSSSSCIYLDTLMDDEDGDDKAVVHNERIETDRSRAQLQYIFFTYLHY